ncbi:MAG: ABC transporter permease [Chloroflexota bacterium]|nr:ABC transporter permease [Chloroflexota bacterium]
MTRSDSRPSSRSTFWPYTRFQFLASWRSTGFWMIGLVIYCGLIVGIYPSVSDAIDISLIPANLRAAFNINDFTQLASFLSSELFGVILPLFVPFYGIIALSNVVAGAEERGRLDVLLGNPIPRHHLILGSFLVVAISLFFLVAVIGTVVFSVATALDLELTARQTVRAAFALWPLTLAFSALALAMSSIVRQRSVALGVPAAILFLMYLVNVIGRLAPAVSGIRLASAYHYYGSAIIEGVWWTGAAVLLAATVALVIVAVIMFDRRDIYA